MARGNSRWLSDASASDMGGVGRVRLGISLLDEEKKMADAEKISLSDEILYFIAKNISTNIRELEGAFIRLAGYAKLTHREISLELAQESAGRLDVSLMFVRPAIVLLFLHRGFLRGSNRKASQEFLLLKVFLSGPVPSTGRKF